VGLQREQVYIANILKCRPPNNRDPRPDEVACCEPYLARQIALIQPRIILAVGRIAAQNLLKCETPIGKLRGRVHRYADTGIPVIATYHPAYLLRSPLEKRKAWDDLRLAMATVARGAS
jgi:DNA polymerase